MTILFIVLFLGIILGAGILWIVLLRAISKDLERWSDW